MIAIPQLAARSVVPILISTRRLRPWGNPGGLPFPLEVDFMFRRIAFVATVTLLTGTILHSAENAASIERLRKDLTYLASDECEGRGAQTKGLQKAADYIVAEYQRLGLKPGGVNGGYFQPYTMRSGAAKLSGVNSVTLKGPLGQEIELKLGEQFQALGFAGSGVVSAPIVFVGYGLHTPELKYDDYKDI